MPTRHLIKKYANRKLYDTTTSRYITLDGISELVRQGHDIEVLDRVSGRDITPLILSQIVMTEEKRGERRAGDGHDRGHALLNYVRRGLTVPAMVSNEVGRRRGELENLVDRGIEEALKRLSIPTRSDLQHLERRIDALQAQLKKQS